MIVKPAERTQGTGDGSMRVDELIRIARRRKLDQAVVTGVANLRALTGLNCDNGLLEVRPGAAGRAAVTFYTDFRYVPMVHRMAPGLRCCDIRGFKFVGGHIGIEYTVSHARYLSFAKAAPRNAKFVDLTGDLETLRMVKTPEETEKLRAAERLVCEIWNEASASFEAGMTERQMAAVIRKMMIDRGEGEAFATIVCVGRNAAECHHEPDDTVWNGREPVLVDIGVKLDGVCSDLTRNLVPGFRNPSGRATRAKPSRLYRQVYELVLEANLAAIAAARPGLTGRQLDKVARDVIAKGGFGRCFGHSLGHGVGYEIHEPPTASKRSETVLKPGMVLTIEPGVYLEDNLGVRIEDLILITETGCEVLSSAAAK